MSNICVEAYCDLGYIFDKERKKSIIDVCFSIPVPDEKEEEDDEEKEKEKEKEEESKGSTGSNDSDGSTNSLYIVIFSIIGI